MVFGGDDIVLNDVLGALGGLGGVLEVLGVLWGCCGRFNWCLGGVWKVVMEEFLWFRGVLMCFGRFSGYC